MAQLIIIEQNKATANNITTLIKKKYKHDVLIKDNAKDAIAFLELIGDIQLIVCPELVKAERTSIVLSDYLIQNEALLNNNIHLLIFGKEIVPYKKASYLDQKNSLEKIVHTIGFILGDEKEAYVDPEPVIKEVKEKTDTGIRIANKLSPPDNGHEATTVFQLKDIKNLNSKIDNIDDYKAIEIYFLYSYKDFSIGHAFYTLTKKQNENAYAVKIEANQVITKAEIERYLNRGVSKLYVEKNSYAEVRGFLIRNFVKNFVADNISMTEQFRLNEFGYKILCGAFSTQEFSAESVELIKMGLKTFEELTKREDALDVFKAHLNTRGNFSYSYLNSHFCCLLLYKLIDKFEWSKDFTKNKILYLSYFHDMTLGSDYLIKSHHFYFDNFKQFKNEEIEVIKNHADLTAKTLERIAKAPKDLVALIREHHGTLDGHDIAPAINLRILPLSKLFIVIEDFVSKYLVEYFKNPEFNEEEVIKFILESLKGKYNKPVYTESLEALQAFLIKVPEAKNP